MGKLLRFGCGAVVLIGVLVVVVMAVGGRGSGTSTNDLAYDYLEPGPRSGDYAGFNMALTNNGAAPMENPQIRLVVDLGGKTWSCQGYVDPTSGEAVVGTDPVMRPLVIPPGSTYAGTIFCRMPEAPLETAKVRLR